ncbi:MAG TPA: peptidoglycan-binding protein [Caulobacteraceae bacterium]
MAEGPEDATSQEYFSQPQGGYLEASRGSPFGASQPRYEALGHPADEVGRVTSAIERLSERIEAAESRQALAVAGIERSVREVIGRIDDAEREQTQIGTRFEGALREARSEAGDIAQRLRRVEEEAARPRDGDGQQALAVAGVERVVREVAGRLDDAQREQAQLGARFEGALQEARGETVSLAQRLRRIEDEAVGPRSVEALRALEGAVGKVAGHVYDSEKRSRDAFAELQNRVARLDAAEQASLSAIRELKHSCTALDGRLSLSERGTEDGVERAAAELAARVDANREELSRQLAAAADARFDRVEQALVQMTEHVRTAEARNAGALERMGREVLDVAQTLSRRVHTVERSSAEAADRVGAEVSRIATAVEDRFARADSVQAQALEKLGGEIARITERLAERIANAERRSAQAIDDVGEQFARISERLTQRSERSAGELADRIRQSEERTARLLEDARQKLDDRMAETQRRIAEPAPAPRAPVSQFEDDVELEENAPFPGFETPPAERPFPATSAFASLRKDKVSFDDEDFEAAAAFEGPPKPAPVLDPDMTSPPPALASRAAALRSPALRAPAPDHDFDSGDLEPNVGFDVEDELVGPASHATLNAQPLAPPPPTAFPSRPPASATSMPQSPPDAGGSALSTRDVIERARAAAKAASVRDGMAKARAAARPADDGVLQNLAFGRARKRPGGMSGALMVASLLAALGLSAGGYVFLDGKPGGKLPKRVADALSVVTSDPKAAGADGAQLAAVAFTAKPDAPAGPDLSAPYSAAVAKVKAGQAGGLAAIRKLADGGYAPAELFLSQLYQGGENGVKKDPTEARHWLERAAEGGERNAMHNLALDEHDGVGGPKNAAAAAEWFRRAAELGLLDSQFNLASLYERGDGVSQNPAEAYKWYLIAARAGDAGAKAGALRVRAGLTPDARAVAERAAAEFQPSGPASLTAAAAPPLGPAQPASPDLVTAQRALNQLGYYQGPTDGASSPALHLALAAYQRDQSLPVTGAPDQATIGKLSVYTR